MWHVSPAATPSPLIHVYVLCRALLFFSLCPLPYILSPSRNHPSVLCQIIFSRLFIIFLVYKTTSPLPSPHPSRIIAHRSQTNYALSVADAERRADIQRVEAAAQRAELERRAEAFRFTEAVRLSEGACVCGGGERGLGEFWGVAYLA